MCGIAGIINLKFDDVDLKQRNRVEIMLDQMRHRGPDEIGMITKDQYSIGATRLKIVGGDMGKQPLLTGSNSLVFNGEIYNYKSLAKDYLNNNFDLSSDSNILFQILSKYGMDKLSYLNGMFSFCYIDKENIYLVRDRFGKKPLYYTIKNNQLFFASEAKAFIGLVDFKLQLPKFYNYLETPLDGETIFKDIYEVKSSTYLVIDRKNMTLSTHQYCSMFNIQEERGSEKKLKEKLRWLIEDSIKLRTETHLPCGVFVSGGIDSSILALLVKPQFLLTHLPKTSSIESEDLYADIIASKLPTSTYLKITSLKEDFLKQLIQTVYLNGGPTTTLAAPSQYSLSLALSNEDVRLAFSGIGIDEFFNGYVRHAISLIPREYFGNQIFDNYHGLINKIGKSSQKWSVYANLLNRSFKNNTEFTELIKKVFNKTECYSNSSIVSICDAFFTLPPLLHTDDHLNMAFGIESRAPFLDYRLVNFALGLPANMKTKIDKKGKVYLKYLLRETFKDILPREIYSRKDKIGFSSNANDLLRNDFSFLVSNSKSILEKYLPEIDLIKNQDDSFQPYARWEYQVVQIAITYLLYCRKYSPKDVELILSKGALI